MKKVAFLSIILIFSVLSSNVFGQNKKFHAVFIYNFYKQMDWPPNYKERDFIIAILGNSPVIPLLKEITATKSAGSSNKFVIKTFKSISEISTCHILFIPESNSSQLKSVKTKLSGTSTLLITTLTVLDVSELQFNDVTIT